MKKVSLKDLYCVFVLVGLQLLGGGYVIIPLLKDALIEKRRWITDEELAEFCGLAQSLPGIIAANVSAFVGYKIRGKSGALVAILGVTTTPIISILLIATILDKITKFSFIQSIFWGVGIAIIVLLYLTIKDLWKFSMVDIPTWIIFFATILSVCLLNVSPAIALICAVIFGIICQIIEEKRTS